MMTPCEKLGYKVGDKFEMLHSYCGFKKGQVVTLFSDDRTGSPCFKGDNSDYNRADGEPGAYIDLPRVKPVTRSIPEPVLKPTLDQLLQDWRNADDFAQRKQTEADEAAAMRDERWQAVQARAGEIKVMIGPVVSVVSEPELVKPALTGKFYNTKLGSPKDYIPGRHWENEICDECRKRFGQHYNTRCNP